MRGKDPIIYKSFHKSQIASYDKNSLPELDANARVGNLPKASSFFHAFKEVQENCNLRFNYGTIWKLLEFSESRNKKPMQVGHFSKSV
jgi:hypothetical protein